MFLNCADFYEQISLAIKKTEKLFSFIHIDIENRVWEYQVYDVDHGSLYISYYNSEFGVSDVVKTIDKKIRKIMKEFENQKIIVKEREDANE